MSTFLEVYTDDLVTMFIPTRRIDVVTLVRGTHATKREDYEIAVLLDNGESVKVYVKSLDSLRC